ncbi:MAG: hypothetical protein LBQ83_06475 [Candidatus Margulisbacteria bacterium]|jgi:hypothetical protein|nr:hypothetical protein [Candidatus Margulisiibacteriota bacterium]
MTIARGQQMVADDILNLTFFPKGTILTFNSTAWSNASTDFKTIWKICDGQNGTPNLTGRFLRGGASSGTTGSPTSGTFSGADSVTLAASHVPIPAHTHAFSGTSSGGTSHTHAYSGTSSGGSSHTHAYSGTSSGGSGHSHGLSGNTGSGGSHGHTFTGNTDTGHIYGLVRGWESAISADGVLSATITNTPSADHKGDTGSGGATITLSIKPSGTNSNHDGHTHSLSGSTGGETAHTHTYSGTSGGETAHTHTYSGATGGETAHTHTYSGTTSNYVGAAATAAVPTVPAYYQVIYIMKVA